VAQGRAIVTAAEQAPKAQRRHMEPGWYRDIPDEEYHRGTTGWSSSQLKTLLEQTPAHLRHDMAAPSEDTKSTALGGAVHAALLQPHRYDDLVAVLPELNLRRPAEREIRDQFYAEHAGKSIITQAQAETAEKMIASVRAHPMAAALLSDIVPESSVYWWYRSMDPDDDEQYRQMLKVRPDALSIAHPVIVDLKTAIDASYTAFIRAVMRHYYHVSAAMYLEGVNQCKPLLEELRHFAYTKFVFVVVENEEPHPTAVYELSQEFLDIGKALYRRAVRTLRDGIAQDWPAYPEDIRIIEPPPWANRGHIV